MGKRIAAKITGVACFTPPRVVTNFDLEKIVETNDEWIRTRTGISERHYVDPGRQPRIWRQKRRSSFWCSETLRRKKST